MPQSPGPWHLVATNRPPRPAVSRRVSRCRRLGLVRYFRERPLELARLISAASTTVDALVERLAPVVEEEALYHKISELLVHLISNANRQIKDSPVGLRRWRTELTVQVELANTPLNGVGWTPLVTPELAGATTN